MKNLTKYVGIIALVAVIGLLFAACKDDDKNDGFNTESFLNKPIIVPVSFEWDDNYTADNSWGGENPTKPAGYSTVLYPFNNRIKAGDIYLLTVKFKVNRAINSISLNMVDTTENAKPNPWWTLLTDGWNSSDNNGNGFRADTEYEFKAIYNIANNAYNSSKEANSLIIGIDAPHLKSYPAVAGSVESAKASDRITLIFTQFDIVKNPDPGLYPNPNPAPAPNPSDLTGTWICEMTRSEMALLYEMPEEILIYNGFPEKIITKIIFTKTNYTVYDIDPFDNKEHFLETGSYTVSGNIVTFNNGSETFTGTISGNTITFTNPYSGITTTYKKM